MNAPVRPDKMVKLRVGMNAGPEGVDTAALGAELKETLAGFNKAFEEFKAENDKRLSQIEKRGSDDVVTRETTDRINDQLSDMQSGITALNKAIAAGSIVKDSAAEAREAEAEYTKKFRQYLAGGISKEAMAAVPSPRAEMSTLSDPDGGFLVPTQMESTIGRVQEATSSLRGLAQVITISTNEYEKLHELGGTGGGWVDEKQTRTRTDTGTIAKIKFALGEQYAKPRTTQRLLDDAAVDISAHIGREIAIKFNEDEADALVSGDGVNKPKGFLAEQKVANGSWAWGKLGFFVSGVADALSDGSNNGVDPLIDMMYGTKRAYRANGRWLLNDLTLASVRKLKDAEGNYLWQPSNQQGEPSTLLGHAVEVDDYMPDIGAGQFPIAFGDFNRGYLVVDRMGIRVLPDPYTEKPYIVIYTTRRVGGGVQDFEAIKLLKISA